MHDAFLRCANERRLGVRHRCKREGLVAGGDRLLDLTCSGTHTRSPCLIDDGTAGDLARGLFSGLGIGHNGSAIVNESRAYTGVRPQRQRRIGHCTEMVDGTGISDSGRSGDPLGTYRLIAGDDRSLVGGGKRRQGWLHPRPFQLIMDVSKQGFDTRDQRLAIE